MAAADEPRRSGRATKGQHKGVDEPVEATPKTKKGSKAKAAKKAAEPEEEEPEEVIRCVCGDITDDEEGRKFVSCDACEVWQHNVCMGISLDEDEQPEHYFCEQCRPEEHKELLDAMARGEKLWEERQKAAAKPQKKKGGKKGRKSNKGGRTSEVKPDTTDAGSEPPAPSQESGTKRKFEEEPQESPSEPTNGHAPDTSNAAVTPHVDKRRKSSAKAAAASKDPATALVDISLLPKDRQNVAGALTKLVADGIRERSKAGAFRVPDGETADSMGKRIAQLIEYELHQNYGSAGKGLQEYGQKFRAISANAKKNPALLDRLLNKTLTPAELAIMSSADMASDELIREREKMKEEADKQAVMVREDEKPRVRRTHKGDEYVDESAGHHPESVFTSQPVRRRESEMDMDGAGSPRQPSAGSPTMTGPSPINTRPAVSDGRRQSSQNFDINSVWAKTAASPDMERPPSRPLPISNGSVDLQQPGKPTGDADIDRLLADDDADDSYAPADARPVASGVIWQGRLIQSEHSSLSVSARWIGGNDFGRFEPWPTIMPTTLEIEGRLDRARADEYLCGLQWSKKSDVSVLALSPNEDRVAFNVIFDYFHSRKKYAVSKKAHGCSELIKDLYISPVEAGEAAPPHLDLLDFVGLKFPNPEKLLLLTVVINKPAAWEQADAMPVPVAEPSVHGRMSLPGPAASPITHTGGGQFSPAPGQAAFPPNPYGAAPYPPQQQQQARFSPSAVAILGVYVNCPVAQEICRATNGVVADNEAANMRAIFDREGAARDDMNVFSQILAGPGGA